VMSSVVQDLTYTIILRDSKSYAAKPFLAAMVSFGGSNNLTFDQLQKAGPHNGKCVWAKSLVKTSQKVPLEKVQAFYKTTVGNVLSRYENESGPINFALPILQPIISATEFVAKAVKLQLMTPDTVDFCRAPFSLPSNPSLLAMAVGENDLEVFASAQLVLPQGGDSTGEAAASQDGIDLTGDQANSSSAASGGQSCKSSNVFNIQNGGWTQTDKAGGFVSLVVEESETQMASGADQVLESSHRAGQVLKSSDEGDQVLKSSDYAGQVLKSSDDAGQVLKSSNDDDGDLIQENGVENEPSGDGDANPEVVIGGNENEMDDDRVADDALSMAELLSVEEQNHPIVSKLVETVKRLQAKMRKQDKMIMSLNQLTVSQELTIQTYQQSDAEDVAKVLMPSLKSGLGDIKKQLAESLKGQMDQIKVLIKEEGKSALGTDIAGLKSSIATLSTKTGDNYRLTQTSLGAISLIGSNLTAAGLGSQQQQGTSFSPKLDSTPLPASGFSSTPSPSGPPRKSLSRWEGSRTENNSGFKQKSGQGRIKSAARSLAPQLGPSKVVMTSSKPNLLPTMMKSKDSQPSLPRLTQEQVDLRLGKLQSQQSGQKRARRN